MKSEEFFDAEETIAKLRAERDAALKVLRGVCEVTSFTLKRYYPQLAEDAANLLSPKEPTK